MTDQTDVVQQDLVPTCQCALCRASRQADDTLSSNATLDGAFAPLLVGDAVAYGAPSTVVIAPLTVQTNTQFKAGVPTVRTNTVSDFTSLLWPTGDPAYPLYAINGAYGKPAYITYSFPTVKPDYIQPDSQVDETGQVGQVTAASLAAFKGFSAEEIKLVEGLMAKISAAAGVIFLRVDDATSLGEMPFFHIDFSKFTVPTAGGFAAAPGGSSLGPASDVYMDQNPITTVDVLLHEVGHALGLKHPHERNGNIAEGRQLATELDNAANTIMSYENKIGTDLGPLDIQALRYLYGANLPTEGTDYIWDKATETLTQFGTAGADILNGTAANDSIDGGASNDTIIGKDGNNVLNGQDGDDTITGGNGANIFTGGLGNDKLTGGGGTNDLKGNEGDDIFDGGTGSNTIDGGAGNDTIGFIATAGKTFVINGGDGTDTLTINIGDSAPDVLTLSSVTNVETVNTTFFTGKERTHAITINANDAGGRVAGGKGNDVINGANGTLGLGGGAGDDIITANGNKGTISGDDGNDILRIGAAGGNIFAGTGSDKLYASAAKGFLSGGVDGDVDTFIFEKAEFSQISEDRTIDKVDVIQEFFAEDRIDLSALSLTHFEVVNFSTFSVIKGRQNGIFFELAVNSPTLTESQIIGADKMSKNLNLVGTVSGEPLTGGASDDRIDGKGGADRLTGGAGKDIFVVSAAADSTAAAPDTITDFVRGTDSIDLTGLDLTSYAFKTVGNTTEITGIKDQNTANEVKFRLVVNTPGVTAADVIGDDNFAVDQLLIGTEGDDNGATTRLLAGRGNDTIRGLGGNDLINGWEGDDIIEGGAGADHLIGGTGNSPGDVTNGKDVFLYTRASDSIEGATDYIQDFVIGQDKIRFTGVSLTSYAITTIGGSTTITGVENGVKFSLVVATPGLTTADIEGDENFSTDVTKTGDGFNNILEGGAGNDTLSGLGGDDILRGMGGADKLDGGTGNDTLEVTVGVNLTGSVIDGGADTDSVGVKFADVDGVAHTLKLSDLGIRNVENVTDVRAGAKNDILTADISVSGMITMSGWGGDDVLTGSAGRDTLWGGEGNDTLIGNDGDDTLNGQEGIEKLYGGKGNDNLSIVLGALSNGTLPGGYVLDGGDGTDTLFVSFRDTGAPQTVKLSSLPTTGIEKIVVYGGAVDDTLDARGLTISTDLVGGTGLAKLYGGSADDALKITLGTLASGIVPSGYVLDGGGGNDALYVNFAQDNVAQYISVKSLATTSVELIAVNGTSQNDTLNAFGTTIRTDLSGMAGDDTLTAGTLGGALFGGAGRDRLIAGSGDNFMSGGTEADTFVFGKITDSVRGSSDTIGDFVRGVDKIDVTAIKFDAGTFNINRTVFNYSDGSQRIGTEILGKANGVEFYLQVQNVHLDESDFEFKVVNGLKKLSDGYIAGATVYHDANGNAQLDDGEDFSFTDDQGNFELPAGGTGPIRGFGGINIDTGLPNLLELSAPDGALVVDPLTTLVQALVESGTDADAAAAQVKAAFGIDASIVLGTTDLLAEATGGDAAALEAQKRAAAIANIIVTGAASATDGAQAAAAILAALADKIAQGGPALDVTSSDMLGELYADAGLGAVASAAAAASAAVGNGAIQSAMSLGGIATAQKEGALTGNDLDNVLTGGIGADELHGFGGADRLDGGAGDDVLRGGVGADTYSVDAANDRIVEAANAGEDLVYASLDWHLGANIERLTLTGTATIGRGNALDNAIVGSDGDNRLIGGGGADAMAGGLRNDIYHVDDAGDRVTETASGGTDKVRASIDYVLGDETEQLLLVGTATHGTGNELANRIRGGQASQTILGLGGDDVLIGGDGNDMLDGGAANDVLVGGAGRDTLTGGAGRDTFRFGAGDLGGTAMDADVITDFGVGGRDRVDLSRIDAVVTTAADDSFHFIGTDAFTGLAGELRFSVIDGDTLIQGDTNGDGIADFALQLSGTNMLILSDFVV